MLLPKLIEVEGALQVLREADVLEPKNQSEVQTGVTAVPTARYRYGF